MATRGRHTRDDGQREFSGRVRHWTRVWVPSKETKVKELKFQRWMRTDERLPELAGPRRPYITPYKDPAAKPYPQHRFVPQPVAAAAGAGIKRGKSQASIAADGGHHAASAAAGAAAAATAATASQQQPAGPAPKFKLKFTLGAKPGASTPSAGAAAGEGQAAGLAATSGAGGEGVSSAAAPSISAGFSPGAAAVGEQHAVATAAPAPGVLPAGAQQQPATQQQQDGAAPVQQLYPPPLS